MHTDTMSTCYAPLTRYAYLATNQLGKECESESSSWKLQYYPISTLQCIMQIIIQAIAAVFAVQGGGAYSPIPINAVQRCFHTFTSLPSSCCLAVILVRNLGRKS